MLKWNDLSSMVYERQDQMTTHYSDHMLWWSYEWNLRFYAYLSNVVGVLLPLHAPYVDYEDNTVNTYRTSHVFK